MTHKGAGCALQGSGRIPAIPVPRAWRLRGGVAYGETLCQWATGGLELLKLAQAPGPGV